jgi:uroporphyrinogen III methyltransferase/synthase
VAEAARRENIRAPALVVVGEVVALRDRLSWFTDRRLFGRRVLVTRPRHQAGDMVRALEELGADVIVLPTVEIALPAHWELVDSALARLATFDWLVFTSANGVQALLGRLRHVGRDLRALGGVSLATIGPATAEALRGYHLEPDVVPAAFNSEGLVEALRSRVAGKRVLLARADRGIDLLREELARVAEVEQVAVYAQRDALLEEGHPTLAQLRAGEVEFVTLTSSNIARTLIAALGPAGREQVLAGRVRLVTISPRTSAAVREQGLPVAGEAQEYTTGGVIEALCALARP